MTNFKSKSARREFLKMCGVASMPLLVYSGTGFPGASVNTESNIPPGENRTVNFVSDGLRYSPAEYLSRLVEIDKTSAIQSDAYGRGGSVEALEKEFARITGKEDAVLVPTGTMANQLAIKLLNGDNTKVMVPENSHVFRDEADAAQAVHGLRLVPVGKDKPFFDLDDLKTVMQYYESGEVFKSGLGTTVVEHPVRRANGTAVPFETIQKVSQYCRSKGMKLHLDGARLHIAAAYTGVPVSDYAACFDTVYISLYKYLNASSGAILCASREFIRKIRHQIKIMGGTTYQNWNISAMALDSLKGVEEVWKSVVQTSDQLFDALNGIEGIEITPIENGTNIYDLKLDSTIDARRLMDTLRRSHNIQPGRANGENQFKVFVNESILSRPVDELIRAWQMSARESRQP